MQRTCKIFLRKNRLRAIAVAVAASLVGGLSSTAFASPADGAFGYRAGQWVLREAPSYVYAKGSSSRYLTPKEAALRHTLSITIQQNVINRFSFKVGCMMESATPLFELNVSSLDIRVFDSINDFVFARFLVDDNQEYSLRGEIVSSDRILFVPSTQSQNKNLSDIFLQMREGGNLKIALLQGDRAKAREYTVPLDGFMQYSDEILRSCQSYNQNSQEKMQFLPDYITKEPEGYAAKEYSLKQLDVNVINPNAPRKIEEPAPAPEPVEPQKPQEVLLFTPGGGPASIGPDGRPIGAGGSGGSNNGSLGTAQGPMQIGPDGRPTTGAAQPAAGTNANANTNANITGNGGNGGAAAPNQASDNNVEIF